MEQLVDNLGALEVEITDEGRDAIDQLVHKGWFRLSTRRILAEFR